METRNFAALPLAPQLEYRRSAMSAAGGSSVKNKRGAIDIAMSSWNSNLHAYGIIICDMLGCLFRQSGCRQEKRCVRRFAMAK